VDYRRPADRKVRSVLSGASSSIPRRVAPKLRRIENRFESRSSETSGCDEAIAPPIVDPRSRSERNSATRPRSLAYALVILRY